jgi:hypothetical protein
MQVSSFALWLIMQFPITDLDKGKVVVVSSVGRWATLQRSVLMMGQMRKKVLLRNLSIP